MPAIDTNVLVRLLVGDDARQRALALSLVERCTDSDDTLFVPVTVTLELEWVLRARYRLARDAILETFVGLLETRELEFHEEATVERALYYFRSTRADFAECLHLGATITHERTPFMTFDRQASRLEGARALQ
jgi:predicted nucleic-acid-binding protein